MAAVVNNNRHVKPPLLFSDVNRLIETPTQVGNGQMPGHATIPAWIAMETYQNVAGYQGVCVCVSLSEPLEVWAPLELPDSPLRWFVSGLLFLWM